MTHTASADIVIAGAGPVGMVAALGLERAGFSVALVGPRPRDDRRTTALMNPALDYLESLGLPDFGPDEAAPLVTMRIVDGTARLVRSQPVSFRASEIGETRFGLNIPNTVLNNALRAAVAARPGIRAVEQMVAGWMLGDGATTAHLADGSAIEAALAVAADGRRSPARDAAGIRTHVRDYPQSAIVLEFAHTRPHGEISTEFHTPTGPFTQVPLPGLRSSLVWVVRPEQADQLMALDDAALSARVETVMQSMLGAVTVQPGRQVYRLGIASTSSVAQRRVALVGEAAHVIPPIGAQGMNLGIRDVADLVRVASDFRADPGAEPALAAYRAARRADILARSGAVDLLNRTLLSDFLPAQMARSASLALLAAAPPLRGLFMREGMRPGSGLSGLVSAAREKIGRQRT